MQVSTGRPGVEISLDHSRRLRAKTAKEQSSEYGIGTRGQCPTTPP